MALVLVCVREKRAGKSVEERGRRLDLDIYLLE